MMGTHAAILQVAIPLAAAPICILLRRPRLTWAFALAITWIVFGLSVFLMGTVLESGDIRYHLGGWAAPWGIELRLDALNAFVLVIVAGIAALVLPYAPRNLSSDLRDEDQYLFFSVFLLCLAGLLGMTITGDVFNAFVFLEISALSSYVLISMGGGRRALTAAYQYLIMGTIGSTFILIGVGLMYMMTGTLNMADLAVRLPAVAATRTVLAAFAFLTVGISLKSALFPLHTWLPNAYTYAPSMVSAFLASTATKVSFYFLLRILFSVFGVAYVIGELHVDQIFLPFAIVAIFAGSTVAIFQTNVKRLLAYSSVAQIGYMVLGLSFASVTGLTGSIIHLFNHAMMKGALFLAVGCLALRFGSVELKDLRGAGRRMPWTMAAFVVGGLNLIGVPFTAGFVSKWYLVLAAVQDGRWLVAVLTLLSSLLAAVYVWRVVEVAYLQEPDEGAGEMEVSEAPWSMRLPTCALAGASLVFGIYPNVPVAIARQAAQTLLEVTP